MNWILSRRDALGSLATVAFAAVAGRPAAAQSPAASIPIGTTPNDSSGPMFYAADLGWFKKAGLDIAMTIMNNPAPIVAAVAGGSIAIAGMPVSLAAIARDKGLPIVMFAPLSLYLTAAPDHAMIVLKDSPLRKASDLNGKTVATRDLGNMSYFGAKAWIDKNGGDSKTIHWVESNDTLDVAALQAGRVDAASISEPALDGALQSGQVRMMAKVFDAIAPRFLIAGCVTSESYAGAHPDIIRRYADVIASTAKWANANQPKSAEILSKYAQAPVPPGSTRSFYAERLVAAEVQPVLDLLYATAQIKSPLRAGELFSSVVPTS